MKLLKKISSLFTGSGAGGQSGSLEIAVRCSRCGEVIHSRIDLANDLSAEYGENDRETSYHCRKILIGKQNCFASIEVSLRFDAGRKLVEHEISGGTFVEG
jgi:hypothetical protein